MKPEIINISDVVRKAAGAMPEEELRAYVHRVYELLPSLAPGRITISTITKDNTRALFIEVVKQYMRETPWYGHLSLADNFSVLVKHRIF